MWKVYLERIMIALRGFMMGRNGTDPLCIASLVTGLVFAILGSLTGFGLLSLLSTALYVWTLFRCLSRNIPARQAELEKYEMLRARVTGNIGPAIRRLKNQREYRYFHCPACKTRLRMRRGRGQVDMICPRCSHSFRTHS